MATTNVLNKALSVIYPGTCAGCGQRGDWLCELCETDVLPLLPSACCDRCGHPVLASGCACRTMHPAIIRARAMTVFDGWPAQAIRQLKYDRERARAPFLAERMIPAFQMLGKVDAIIPVPLHPKRQLWRGFNQAELLAHHLGAELGTSREPGLQRIRSTDTQTHSSREDRIANMDGAFALTDGWRPKPDAHYVLLDDVYTTGATLSACAEVLEAAGAKLISVIAVAFDLQKRELEEYRVVLNSVGT